MKIDNEIGKLARRVNSLENQNVRFKSLLDSTIEITKQSASRTQFRKDETEFLSETIKLIEAEKSQLQDDLISLKQSEKEDILVNIRRLEDKMLALNDKTFAVLRQTEQNAKDIEQLKLEHGEFKFLLTQPDSNAEWLKNIFQLDETTVESVTLNEQRYNLQRKIYKLEKKKTELMSAIEDGQRDACCSRTNIESSSYAGIDEESKSEYEDLHLKVLELEQERSALLGQLQLILEQSRKEIADEYCQLQKKILDIETEKAELKQSLINFDGSSVHTIVRSEDMVDVETIPDENEIETVEKVLNAFSNTPVDRLPAGKQNRPSSDARKGDFCALM